MFLLFKEDSMKQQVQWLSPWQQSLMLTRAVLVHSGMDSDQLDEEIDMLDLRHKLRRVDSPLLDPPLIELMGNMEGFTDACRVF